MFFKEMACDAPSSDPATALFWLFRFDVGARADDCGDGELVYLQSVIIRLKVSEKSTVDKVDFH
jgi:hypothetical protein